MENMAEEESSVDFGRSRIQLVEESPTNPSDSGREEHSNNDATCVIPLNSPGEAPPNAAEIALLSSPSLHVSAAGAARLPADPALPFPQRNLHEYFAFRDGGHTLEKAVEKCLPIVLQADQTDGNLIGVWMLTEITHWDMDQERLLFLTEHSLIIAKYDLIQMVLIEFRRIPLRIVEKIQFGPLRYPQNSILLPRNQTGLRLMWNSKAVISLTEKWNPFSQMNYLTLTSHNAIVPVTANAPTVAPPAVSTAPANDSVSVVPSGPDTDPKMAWCKVDDFKEKVKEACRREADLHEGGLQFQETDILIENYAGMISKLFNAAQLGFFKSRGRISF